MKIYLVGGAVRDGLLGLPINDHDWVVVQATPEKMISAKYIPVGKDFPVFLHPETHEEYALARTERKIGTGYNGFECFASIDVTIEEDLLRRDLTINAIAFDLNAFKEAHNECKNAEEALITFKHLYQKKCGEITQYLVDPFNGMSDIHSKTLKHVSNAFREDPLRVLRLARFYAQFYSLGFQIAQTTKDLIQFMVKGKELTALTKERVWLESLKALKTDSPHVYFKYLQECRALEQIYPTFNQSITPMTLAYLQNMAKTTSCAELRFAVLLCKMTQSPQTSHLTDRKAFNTFFETLRISNEFKLMVWIATKVELWHKLFELTPHEILGLLTSINYPRQKETLENFIVISTLITQTDNPHCQMTIEINKNKAQFLKTLHTELEEIDVIKFVDMGLVGSEIKEAISLEKSKIISKLLIKHQQSVSNS